MASTYNASPITSWHIPARSLLAASTPFWRTRLLAGETPAAGYQQRSILVLPVYQQPPFASELPHFQSVFGGVIAAVTEDEFYGDGHVVHSFEANLWCLLWAGNYRETVLTAEGRRISQRMGDNECGGRRVGWKRERNLIGYRDYE